MSIREYASKYGEDIEIGTTPVCCAPFYPQMLFQYEEQK